MAMFQPIDPPIYILCILRNTYNIIHLGTAGVVNIAITTLYDNGDGDDGLWPSHASCPARLAPGCWSLALSLLRAACALLFAG